MHRSLSIALIATLLTAPAIFTTPVSATDAAATPWQEPYVGSRPDLLYLPDANAIYWRYGWTREPGDAMGLAVRGRIPNARYFSYNVYDDTLKNSVGSMPDNAMVLDNDVPNPFAGIETDARGTYTLYIVPEGQTVAAPNVLTFPDTLTELSIMLRHYLPRPADDIQGGAPLPTLHRFDPRDSSFTPAPPSTTVPALSMTEAQKYLLPMLEKLAGEVRNDPQAALDMMHDRQTGEAIDMHEIIVRQVVAPFFKTFEPDQPVQAYRFPVEGNYPTADNFYLVHAAVRQGEQAFLTRFRVPDVAQEWADFPDAQVRYFSLSQGDERTYNYQTLHDTTLSVDAQGFITLLIADDELALRAKAKELGANFMPWQVQDKLALVYRNMMPKAGFDGGIQNVPFYDLSKPPAGQDGRAFIGDYAPVGRMIDEAELLKMQALPSLE